MSSSASIAPFSEGSNSDPFVEYEQIDTTIDTDQARIEEMANIPNYEEQGGGGDGEDKAKDDESGALVRKQRVVRSGIWGSFSKVKDANGMVKAKCNHCGILMSWQKSGTTSHLSRHMKTCTQRKLHMKQQGLLNFQPTSASASPKLSILTPAIVGGKYDPMKMKEVICH